MQLSLANKFDSRSATGRQGETFIDSSPIDHPISRREILGFFQSVQSNGIIGNKSIGKQPRFSNDAARREIARRNARRASTIDFSFASVRSSRNLRNKDDEFRTSGETLDVCPTNCESSTPARTIADRSIRASARFVEHAFVDRIKNGINIYQRGSAVGMQNCLRIV